MALIFGLGTLPGLLLLGTGLSALVRRFRRASDLLAGMVMMALATGVTIWMGARLFGIKSLVTADQREAAKSRASAGRPGSLAAQRSIIG